MKKLLVYSAMVARESHALNLRDSGNKVLIANQNDKYSKEQLKINLR